MSSPAATVVANADAGMIYSSLIKNPPTSVRKASRAIAKMEPSLAGFSLLLGLTPSDAPKLEHHTVLFPEDYDEEFETKATMFGKTLHRDGRSKEELLAEALKVANQSDVIVAALGESAEMSGESSSRTNLEIPQAQKDLLNALLKTGKPVVLVLINGSALSINWANDNVPAILTAGYPGQQGGNAIADGRSTSPSLRSRRRRRSFPAHGIVRD